MMEKKQAFANPLDLAAQTGVLGRRKITSSEEPGVAVGEISPESTQVSTPAPRSLEETPEKKKKTILMTPERARWLKRQSADEDRDMSAIAEDAFALYEKLHQPRLR